MSSLVILGAGGFLGRAIIAQRDVFFPIKAVARKTPVDADLHADNITWYELDLLVPHSLDSVLEPGDIVVNTAYLKTGSDDENLRLVNNIIDSCRQLGAKRLLHCSTAVVAGMTKKTPVDETTPCAPYTPYERNKFALEKRVLECLSSNLEVIIVRPTPMVGLGGKNLLKLAESLKNGNQFVNYLRACLFRKRKMHLVPVNTVASAILHLIRQDNAKNGDIYYISSDHDAANNFLSVEKFLLQALGRKPRKIPVLPVPSLFLSILLKLKGRSESSLHRIYDSKKLRSTNFTPVDTLHDAVIEFGKSVLKGSKMHEN
jgi:nucleoside-diphosphate-sugar epimerase